MAANPKKRPFRFGLQLSGADSPEAWIDKAKRAESLGYSVVTIIDHMTDQLAPMPGSHRDRHVDHVHTGRDDGPGQRLAEPAAPGERDGHPRLAEQRTPRIGIGAGWLTADYERLGIPYERPGVRVERMAEALEIIRRSSSGEAPAGFSRSPRLADVINVHTNLGAENVVGDQSKADISAEAARRRFEWIREGAASRLQEIELSLRIFFESPYALVGSVDHITEGLIARQEFGATYFTWNEPDIWPRE